MPPIPPVVDFLKSQNVMCYTAGFEPFFDEAKKRVNKGSGPTFPVAKLDGSWNPTTVQSGREGYMMRCGARPSGSGFIVFDVDIHGGETPESLFPRLVALLKANCKCIVRTGSGGYHYYFRMPEGVDYQVERKIDGFTSGGTEYKTAVDGDGRLDILATGIGVYLPGTSYRHEGKTYTYEYVVGTLADASPLPAYLKAACDARPGMMPKKRNLKLKAPAPAVAPPTAPTPPVAPVALGEAPALPGRSLSPLKTDEDLKLVASLLDCITGDWVASYDNWRNLGFCLKTITAGRGADMYVKVAKRSQRHQTDKDEGDTRTLFAQASDKGSFGFASLNAWARHCSPEKHHACFKDNYLTLLSQGNKGHADIFANELAGSCVYDSETKKFYLWVEHKELWVEVNEDNITSQFMTLMPLVVKRLKQGIPQLAGKPKAEGEESRASPLESLHEMLQKHLKAFQNNMAEAVMKCVRDTLNPKISYRNIDAFELDKNPDLLPLLNGVWNFREHRLEPYTRQHYLSKRAGRGENRLPLAYDANASQDDIKAAMNVWFKGNQRVIDFIQYWLGYVITGHTSRQEFLILYGKSGGNGKSALIAGILQGDILGKDYACSMGEDALTKVGGNNDDIFYGLESRLAVVTEAGGDGKKAEEINMEALKRITGEDVISTQAKFKGKKEGVFRARVVFCCNSMPRMPQSQAQRRRTIVAEMNTKMLDADAWAELSDAERASGDYGIKNPGFIQRLRANRSGILNWLLEGAKRYIENPCLAPPLDVLKYTDDALALADEERIWFMDGWTFDKNHTQAPLIPFTDVASRYAEHFGIKSTNMSARGKFLKKLKSWIGENNVLGDSNHGYELRCLTPK